MSNHPEYYVKNPKRDFVRNRKLTFKTVIEILLSMGGQSISQELIDYFKHDTDLPSSSAFIQQREKILPSAFQVLLAKFNSSLDNLKTYKGYRLLAVDGSDINIPHNPKDLDNYCQSISNRKGYNILHLNAVYDLCNKLYIDASVNKYKEKREVRSLIDMAQRSKITEKAIFIADRGYESYNVFAHIGTIGFKYIIRVKDIHSNGIVSSLVLPNEDEFDTIVSLKLTRSRANKMKAHPEIYKFLPNNSTFDFLKSGDKGVFPITFRVVRFKISENNYQTVISNLDSLEFSNEQIKELYNMRWGIETSFRELKYALGLINFHSKNVNYIFQEIFARIVMYNFCETLTLHVVIKQKPSRKYTYQANFTRAIDICLKFFKDSKIKLETLISRFILPIRNNRKSPRKSKSKSAISFNYRIS